MSNIESRRSNLFTAKKRHVSDAVMGIYRAEVYKQKVSGALTGDKVHSTQSQIGCISGKFLAVQENERQRIAKDLHDGIGQLLTLISLELEECAALLAANAHCDAEKSLQQVRSKVRHTFGELRRVAMDLRPSMLDDLGILATLNWFFRELENACQGTIIEKHFPIHENHIPAALKIPIFRIIQEAISNILKHAKADHIRVNLSKTDDRLHLSIEDNGQGFDPVYRDSYCFLCKGLGLMSMQERAQNSGGTYHLNSSPGKGTHISVTWPCS
jgi:signal transduction histidine kinase